MESIDTEELQARTEAGLARHKKLIPLIMFPASVVIYVLFMALALTAGMAQGAGDAVAMALIGGFMALVINGITMLTMGGAFDQTLRPQILAQEMAKMLQDHKRKIPPKRLEDELIDEEEVVMLGDDGELYRQRRA
ncbi:hypothetical protein VZO05_14540 [Aggregatilineales bacterium SYSU G02658]